MHVRSYKALALAAFVFATPMGHATAGQNTTPGDPANPNCHGQQVAYQNSTDEAVFGVNGFGNAAKAAGVPVKDYQEAVDAYCEA